MRPLIMPLCVLEHPQKRKRAGGRIIETQAWSNVKLDEMEGSLQVPSKQIDLLSVDQYPPKRSIRMHTLRILGDGM